MAIDFWNRDDVVRILRAVVIARAPLLTGDDVRILVAVAAAFGIEPAEIGLDRRAIDPPERTK